MIVLNKDQRDWSHAGTSTSFGVYNSTEVLSDMATVLNGYLTEAEGQRIAALLRTGQANILDLVPAGLNETT